MSQLRQSNRTALVIGAGVVGVSCALHMQRRGLKVTLIDRGEPGEAASFGNAGRIASLLGRSGKPNSASFSIEPSVVEARERVVAAAREIVNDTLPVAPAETIADVPVPEPRRGRRKGRRDKRARARSVAR